MIIRKTYRFRLYPTAEQELQFRQFSGCCRAVYNAALYQRELYGQRHKLNYVSQANELPACKRSMPWLSDAPSHSLQAALKDLDQAFRNFFARRALFPKPRRKSRGDRFRLPEFKTDFDPRGDHIRIAKAGLVKWIAHREIQGLPKNCTISRDGNWWFASIQCELEIDEPISTSTEAVGVDIGVIEPLALSDGTFPAFNKTTKRHKRRLRTLQQSLSRKRKGSNNRRKAARKVAAYHAHIARRRADTAHKATTDIILNHGIVAIEDLKVSNMTRSSKGTAEKPGKMVKHKSGINREILAVAPFQIRMMLEYKAAWAGVEVVVVPAHYTSQKCAECGHTHKDNRKNQATFACIECGHETNADTNAAINILNRALGIEPTEGLSGLACLANHTSGRQQETIGAIH
tara:strand:- start:152 stop:1360 length:1209 start_codon:yes stop_codon:yes gene_type:complete